MIQSWKIGVGALAVALGLGAIGFSTLSRGDARVDEPGIIAASKPLPLLATRTAPIENIAKLKAVAKRSPQDPKAWATLGTAALNALDYSGAVEAYKTSVGLDPANAENWSALGEAYVHTIKSSNSKMPAPARAAFDKALTLDPNDVRARFYVALERDYSGEHDAAIAAWLGLLRIVPAGSAPDEAIRAAILASLNRNIRLVSKAVQESRRLQPNALATIS